MPTTAYDAKLRRCPRATVGAPDDDLFGKPIQPALNHIGYIPVAHSCAKETSQLRTGGQWCSRNAEICALIRPDPLFPFDVDASARDLFRMLESHSLRSLPSASPTLAGLLHPPPGVDQLPGVDVQWGEGPDSGGSTGTQWIWQASRARLPLEWLLSGSGGTTHGPSHPQRSGTSRDEKLVR